MIALLTLLAAIQASPAPAARATSAPAAAATAAPAPSEDPNVTNIARAQYDAFASGNVDQSLYPQPIPPETIAKVKTALTSLGAVKSVRLVRTMSVNGADGYVYEFTCANGAVLEGLALKDGKIAGIRFSPEAQ